MNEKIITQCRRTTPSIKWRAFELIGGTELSGYGIRWVRNGVAALGEPSKVLKREWYDCELTRYAHLFTRPDFSL